MDLIYIDLYCVLQYGVIHDDSVTHFWNEPFTYMSLHDIQNMTYDQYQLLSLECSIFYCHYCSHCTN